MFNSQKINNDPARYAAWDGERLANWEYELLPKTFHEGFRDRPRPEYDNNPNPILVEFRGAEAPGRFIGGLIFWMEQPNGRENTLTTRLRYSPA